MTEKLLTQAERAAQLLHAIVDSSDDAIISKDLNGTITSWNKSAERLFGYTEAEAVGQPITILIPLDRLDEEPQSLERIKAGERVDHFETVRKRKDGTTLEISLTISPIKDRSGKIVGVSKIIRDISERKRVDADLRRANHDLEQAEEVLRESEELFLRVFEEGPLGLALVEKDYHFVKVNAALCRMVAYPEASLLQMTFADLTYPDDVRTDVELAERLFRGEIPFYTLRKRYVKKSGEIIWINLTASVIRNQQGEPMYGLAMIEDITEVKLAQEAENQLASDLAASRDEIRALAASLMRAQEDERRRVSRELHDHVCHQLGSLAREISNLAAGLPSKNVRAKLEEIQAHVVKTSQETHHIAYKMHTAILDDLGLVASLNALCRQFSEQYPDIAVGFKNSGPPTSIPGEVASCLYRVLEESLQNIAKHSAPSAPRSVSILRRKLSC